MARVSVGMPVYNGAPFLREALDSWLAQEFEDFELIVSDNASTDDTPRILEEYARRDPRLRIVRRPETVYIVKNFNDLVGEASAPLVLQRHGKSNTFLNRTTSVFESWSVKITLRFLSFLIKSP